MHLPPGVQPHLSTLEQHLARFRDDLEGRSTAALAYDLRCVAASAVAAADALEAKPEACSCGRKP